MKLISFTVPCYNSQEYMSKCIDSLLTGGDDVEIIIINDGSKDGTINIANSYQEKYPSIVKVIDKENGGHGSGINYGIKAATGLYFKVVDSDDWLDESALKSLLDTIKRHKDEGNLPDLYVTNFIYDKVIDGTQHVSRYNKIFPTGQICGWEDIKKFHLAQVLMIHALCYKREKYIESETILPEHTFYVDQLYNYKPMPFIKTICYLNLNLYHYLIGRADQSVNMKNIEKRYDQQIRVMTSMIDSYKWEEIKAMPKGLKNYMWHSIDLIMMTMLFFTCLKCTPERKKALKGFWQHLKARDKALYKKIRHRSYATTVVYLPWRIRGFIMKIGYNILCRRVKLG